jgi:hypothetical protein
MINYRIPQQLIKPRERLAVVVQRIGDSKGLGQSVLKDVFGIGARAHPRRDKRLERHTVRIEFEDDFGGGTRHLEIPTYSGVRGKFLVCQLLAVDLLIG